jgi:hypothetical protein
MRAGMVGAGLFHVKHLSLFHVKHATPVLFRTPIAQS